MKVVWKRAQTTINGSEPDFMSTITVVAPGDSNQENNEAVQTVGFGAVADIDVINV